MTDLLTLAARAHYNDLRIPEMPLWEDLSDLEKGDEIGSQSAALLALADAFEARHREIMDKPILTANDISEIRRIAHTVVTLREVAGQG